MKEKMQKAEAEIGEKERLMEVCVQNGNAVDMHIHM